MKQQLAENMLVAVITLLLESSFYRKGINYYQDTISGDTFHWVLLIDLALIGV